MKQNTLKYFIVFAIVVVAGIFLIQALMLKSRFDLSDKQFNESVRIALKEVAWQILEYNKSLYGKSAEFDNLGPVEKVSNDYYVVNVNDVIDGEVLKFHLTEEFKRHGVFTDFEFAVYDCNSDSMEYGAYISTEEKTGTHSKSINLPKSDKFIYYFVVHFPNRSPYFNSRLQGSYVFSFLILLVIVFFGYTLYVILRQRQLSEIQKNFINNLTHELKTPISSIGLAASVISDKQIIENPERLFEYSRIITEQNQRMSKNVEKVLNLATLDKNKIQLNLEPVDLEDAVKSAVNQFSQSWPGPIIRIEQKNDKKHFFVIADRYHLSQVVMNIVENSAKYCSKQPEIRILIEPERNWVRTLFIDNGIGIPANARKKIFKKFYRIPTGNVHNVKGFGLGLDYVRKIAKAHGWKIKVEENPAGGSIFSIFMPLKKNGEHQS
jgi:two-component system phosphate regulon sensor histidine kinase PhoR